MPAINEDARFTTLELRLDREENRTDKYDQIIAEIHRNQDKNTLMLSTFMEEMKDLKLKDIDISQLIQGHDRSIEKQSQQWKMLITIVKWVFTTIITIALLVLGAYIAHSF